MSQIDDTDLDFDFEDDEFDSFDDSKLLKKLRRELTQTKKALKERDSELSSLKSEARRRTVRDVLAEKGLNPKIAAFIPAEIEPTDVAVSAWVEEYGDVFGVPSGTREETPVNVDVDAVGRMSRAEQQGVSASAFDDVAAKIASASSREELQAILRNA